MNKKVKALDRRKKYYLILDCETATLPYASFFPAEEKKRIAIAKPLIYDIAWQVIDRKGKVCKRENFLISEIFSIPSVFNTAYYASKRPIYIERLNKGEVILCSWFEAMHELVKDMEQVEAVGAYNSMFDFKKAIPFTETYISKLYSNDFFKWEKNQNKICDRITKGKKSQGGNFDGNNFTFREKKYPLFDIWGLSCKHLLDCDEYREKCQEKEWFTDSKKFYKTSAETCYRFFKNDETFNESHTAINDAEIESEIFFEILQRTKNHFQLGIIYFPFKILGEVGRED